MKKIVILGLYAVSAVVGFTFMEIGCASTAVPISITLKPTPTPVPTPGAAVFPVLYNDGTFASIPGLTVDEFSGGGSAGYPTVNAADTTYHGYNGDYYDFLLQWTSTELSNLGGYSGIVVTGNAVNFSSYTTCTFWAVANESASVGFNAAEPTGDTANVPESLTTTWTQYTLTITSGSRSDGQPGAITAVQNYFVVVITATPSSAPLNVSVDQVQFQ